MWRRRIRASIFPSERNVVRNWASALNRWQIAGASLAVAVIGFLFIHSYNPGAGFIWNVIHARIYLTEPCARPDLPDFSNPSSLPLGWFESLWLGKCGVNIPYSALLATALIVAAVAVLWPAHELQAASRSGPPPLPRENSSIPPPLPSSASAQKRDDLVGVRGWLLFLCIGLTILGPVATLGSMGWAMERMTPMFPTVPGLENFAKTVMIVSAFSIFASIGAGVMLWTRKLYAPEFTKLILLINIGLACASPFAIYLFVSVPSGLAPTLLSDALPGIVRVVIPCLIWHQYLTRSKRVRATFSI